MSVSSAPPTREFSDVHTRYPHETYFRPGRSTMHAPHCAEPDDKETAKGEAHQCAH